ncbi:MAG: DUF805 domain-containing protein [Victivallales bacterium]|nr:DUF805 domain-containing protein [Victivallales bacterium]
MQDGLFFVFNKSGWYYLVVVVPCLGGILLLLDFCMKGTIGPNQYGSDPSTS